MPDLSFILRIRETEEEQRLRLEQARASSDSKKAAAREEAADIVADAWQEAEHLRRDILGGAEAEYRKMLETAESFRAAASLDNTGSNELGEKMAERIVDFLGRR